MQNIYPITPSTAIKKLSKENKSQKNLYSGGRHLDAIWTNQKLSTNQRVVIQCIASFANFTKIFEYQWRYVSISTFIENTGLKKDAILRILNGYEKRNQKGLIELGYVKKKLATKEKQLNGEANDFCLTEKIFTEYAFQCSQKKQRTLSPTERGGESPTERGGESPTERQNPKDLNPKDLNPSFLEPQKKIEFKNSEKQKTGKAGPIGSFAVSLVTIMKDLRAINGKPGFWDYYKTVNMIKKIMAETGKSLEEVVEHVDQLMVWEGRDTFVNLKTAPIETITEKFIEWCISEDSIKKNYCDAKERKRKQEHDSYLRGLKREEERKEAVRQSASCAVIPINAEADAKKTEELRIFQEKKAKDKELGEAQRKIWREKQEATFRAMAPKTPEDAEQEREEMAKIIQGF